jgi:hypothetical protein
MTTPDHSPLALGRRYTAPAPGQETAAAGPTTYLPLPRPMVEDLRDAPAALGAYALIARLYMVTGAPVPLSPGDLQAFDPALSYGAARRALDRLADTGYALALVTAGRKTSYLPSWGTVGDSVRLWDRDAPLLGRPRHIRIVRLDDRLLDLYLGRLRPSASHQAIVERYVAAPLLGLRDVGGYAMSLAGVAWSSHALLELGLVSHTRTALPLPEDRAILALASRRPQPGYPDGLTPAGQRLAGLAPQLDTAPAGQVPFFVPPGVIGEGIGEEIGGGIGGVIGDSKSSRGDFFPSQRPKTGQNGKSARSHGLTESTESDGTTTTQSSSPTRSGGGGVNTSSPAPTPPASAVTESERQLRSLGVRADIARQLGERPTEQVARVIAQARARQGIRDLPAWVVSALRALPADEIPADPADDRLVSARPIYFHPGLDCDQRSDWLMRFRAARTPADQRAVLARLEREHPR